MLKTVEGTYRQGKVELREEPGAVAEGAQVLVTFLSPEPQKEVEPMRFGMLRAEGRPESTWADFELAKQSLHKQVEDEHAR
jgi:hypothetical protein